MHPDPPIQTLSGHQDPPGEAPWALQIVARIEKDAPPAATSMLEAAAMAVVALLAHPESESGGAWEADVQRWLSGRIRKLARRARGVAWQRVQELPGVRVHHHGADVRALVPGPTDAVPREVHSLQLQGFDLADPHRAEGPTIPDRHEVLIAANPAVEISLGKAAAQVGHASNLAWLRMGADRRRRWALSGFPTRVVHPGLAAFGELAARAPVQVVDAGFTELDGPALTCVADWSETSEPPADRAPALRAETPPALRAEAGAARRAEVAAALRAEVAARRPVDAREEAAVRSFLAAFDRLPDPFDQEAGPVHVTASAIVIGPTGVLLHHHKRLGLWLQPGGHIEPGESPWVAASRETAEETGLVLRPDVGAGGIPEVVHVDVHDGGRGHTHLDVRYLLRSPTAQVPQPAPGESPQVQWFGWDEAIDIADDGLRGALLALRPSG